jgi:hypothetical protein
MPHTLWLLHNGECHGTKQHQKLTRQLQQLKRDLNDLFQYKPTLLASNLKIFDVPVSKLITSQLPKSKSGSNLVIPSSFSATVKPSKIVSTMSYFSCYTYHFLPRRHPPLTTCQYPPSYSQSFYPVQLMTDHFALIQSTHVKWPSMYQPTHRTLEQPSLLFSDNQT